MAEVSKKRSHAEIDPPDEAEAVATTKRRATAIVAPTFQKIVADIKWTTPFGTTCLFGEFLEPPVTTENPRVILFDLDGTLIVTKNGRRFPESHDDWKWFSSKVPAKLRELHKEGYALVVVTNQFLPKRIPNQAARRDEWKKKLNLVAHALHDVPFRILAATAKDQYRKPLPGMWYVVQELFKTGETVLDPKKVVFVGNAAGRRLDHSATDRKLAQNLGFQFYTPEEYFLGDKPLPFGLTGYHPSTDEKDTPLYLPSSSPLVPPTKRKPVMMLFVGFPALGKTRAYKKYFEPAGYVHINQDTLKSKVNCVIKAEKALKAGKSVVIDDTNRDMNTRSDYIDLARALKVEARCLIFEGTIQQAWHNNVYRAFCLTDSVKANEEPRDLLDQSAFTSFNTSYEKPVRDEGFKDIKQFFWKFEGTEAEKARYMMWLEL